MEKNKTYKLISYFIIIIYSWLYMYGYINYLNYFFGYLGCDLQPERDDDLIGKFFIFLICLFPYLFYKGIKQISSFFAYFIYYLLYIPTVITLYYGVEGTYNYIFYIECIFMASMSLIFISSNFYIKLPALPSKINLKITIWIITAIITLIIIWYYGSSLKLVGFDKIYDLRKQNDTLQDNTLLRYVFVLLLNALIPFLIGIYSFTGKKSYLYLGIISSIIYYMANGAKVALFAPLVMLSLKFLLTEKKINRNVLFIPVFIILIMIYTLSIDFSLTNSIFWYRAIGMGGILNKTYHDFFVNHEYTYYSHINFINFFTNAYPYGSQSLGELVGSFFWSDDINANANFWATDGFAAYGEIGVFIATIFLSLFFILFNSVSYHYNKIFVIIVTFSYLGTLLNASLFSSFITGGGLLICLLLSFSDLRNDKRFLNENTNAM